MKEKRKLRPGETVFVMLMMGLSIFVLVMAYRISGFSSVSSPGAFPMAAALAMVVSAGCLIVQNCRLEPPAGDNFAAEMKHLAKEVFPKEFILYVGLIVVYMVIIEPLHFLPSSLLFLVVSMIFLRGGTFFRSLLVSAVTLAFIYVVFQYFFRVIMP